MSVFDVRNASSERMQILVDADTKTSAGKICRELSYTVRSMGWV